MSCSGKIMLQSIFVVCKIHVPNPVVLQYSFTIVKLVYFIECGSWISHSDYCEEYGVVELVEVCRRFG